jgi:hypothetical protein
MQRSLAIVLFIFALIGCWIFLTAPIDSFPDESSHLNYAKYIYRHHQLPPLSLENKPIPTNEGFQPPLYYIIAALLTATFENESAILVTIRTISLFLGMLTIIVIWKSALLVFPEKPNYALLITAFAAFNPQFIYSHSGISNIALTSFTTSLAIFLMARMIVLSSISNKDIVLFGISCGAALLSRTIAIYLIPLGFAGLLFISSNKPQAFRLFLKSSATYLGIVFLVCGWWYLRNWLNYTDPFLWRIHQTTMGAGWGRSEPLTLFYVVRTLAFLHASYWAYFGRNEFHAGIAEYSVFLLIEVLAIIGVYEIFTKKNTLANEGLNRTAFYLFVISSLIAFLEILFLQLKINSPQGRYLYMAVAGNSVIIGTGLIQITPQKYRAVLSAAFPVFLLISCLYLLIRYWYPHY